MEQSFESSPGIGAVAGALAKAQAKITTADKDRKNPHFGSVYATLASVQAACQGPLAENGIAVIQPVSVAIHEGEAIVTVRTILAHESGEWIGMGVSFVARDPGPQAVGSCITYGRRYGLASMAGVAPEDDDGQAGQGSEPRAASTPRQAARPIRNKYAGPCHDCGAQVPEGEGEATQVNGKWTQRHGGDAACKRATGQGDAPEVAARAVPNAGEAACSNCDELVPAGKGWQRGGKVVCVGRACIEDRKAKQAERELAGAST